MNTTSRPGQRLAAAASIALSAICLHAGMAPETAQRTTEAVLGLFTGSAHATELFVEPLGVGIGIDNPQRLLHIKGDNAIIRMDRSTDAATFMMVRTDWTGTNVWKTFSVGTRASGPNNGEFVIQDFGTATSGASQRRMTITNSGNVEFTGSVSAPAFIQTSSAAFKRDIETLDRAAESLVRLRGVRFAWADSGKPAIGFIAEEVAPVYPELVAFEDGVVTGVNYAAMVAVLVEAVKAQQAELAGLKEQQAQAASVNARLADENTRVEAENTQLTNQLDTLTKRLAALEHLVLGPQVISQR